MAKLVVLEGPNRGAVISLLPGRNQVGRAPEDDVSLPDESVSRPHAEISLGPDGAYVLRDLGSRNGTLLNGVRLAGAAHPLIHGDELRFGATAALFVDDDESGGAVAAGATTLLVAPPPEPAGDQNSSVSHLSVPHTTLTAQEKIRASRAASTAFARPQPLVGESAPMRRLRAEIERLAPLDTTVLVTGESGSGKELVAEALHRLSRRRRGPFVAVNCATLGPALIESDLFGHERGAFTGAVARKLGKLELARGGTLFLDEVGELPLDAQAKLLRAIERREFQRVGGVETIATDARLVAATNRDLVAAAREGRFREDLLYRLRVVDVAVPPLRARGEDIPALIERFLAEVRERVPTRLERFSAAALATLARWRFPGNVRELRNLVERAAIFCEGPEAGEADLPAEVREPAAGADANPLALVAVERRHILEVLKQMGGNKTRAAEVLGIDRVTLYARLRRYGLAPDGP